MQITVSVEEARCIRKGLKSFIKHKRSNIKCIEKKLPEAPEDAEVTGIRKAMLARRYEAIESAQTLLNDLNHVIGDEVSV